MRTLDTLVTKFYYDIAGRKIREKAPDGKEDTIHYDLAGNVIEMVTRRGHHIGMSYDELNRLAERITPAVSYDDKRHVLDGKHELKVESSPIGESCRQVGRGSEE